MFAADSLPGVGHLDNLGIPESGDGISDVLQEAKWEADFLAKMQDTDGGFYFLVYPQNREYEGNVTPDRAIRKLVWPKNIRRRRCLRGRAGAMRFLTGVQDRPIREAAAIYLQKAKLGWQFLTNAIDRYGKNGAYQKITHYGDDFADQDELAWAALRNVRRHRRSAVSTEAARSGSPIRPIRRPSVGVGGACSCPTAMPCAVMPSRFAADV